MRSGVLRVFTWVALYFALHGLLSILEAVFSYTQVVGVLVLFPVTKLLGDAFTMLVQQQRIHAFWEEWLKETLGFSALSVVALIASEFWANVLKITYPPGLVFVAVIAYTVTDNFRRGAKQQSELS